MKTIITLSLLSTVAFSSLAYAGFGAVRAKQAIEDIIEQRDAATGNEEKIKNAARKKTVKDISVAYTMFSKAFDRVEKERDTIQEKLTTCEKRRVQCSDDSDAQDRMAAAMEAANIRETFRDYNRNNER